MKIEDYKKELENHDWFYGMSEDSNVYKRGQYAYNKLLELASISPQHTILFNEMKDFKYKNLFE